MLVVVLVMAVEEVVLRSALSLPGLSSRREMREMREMRQLN